MLRNPHAWSLGAFIVLLPVAVEIPATSDSGRVMDGAGGETRVTVLAGGGHYAIIDRGCANEILRTHPHEFHEVAAEIQHRFAGGLTLGVRGGSLRDHSQATILDETVYPPRESLVIQQRSNRYVAPWMGVETDGGGIGIGWMSSDGPLGSHPEGWSGSAPTLHLRIGSLDRGYFKVSYLENIPLYSSGGVGELGFGIHPFRLSDWYFGLGAGDPYDGVGFVVKVDQRIADHLALAARGRFGNSGGEPQQGLALGLSYVSTRPIEVSRPSKPPRPMGSAWGLAPRRSPDRDSIPP